MIRRPPRSTLSSSSAASDVYKRQGINAEYGDRFSCVMVWGTIQSAGERAPFANSSRNGPYHISQRSRSAQDGDRSGRHLYVAAQRGDTAAMYEALADGASWNWRHPRLGEHALHTAAELGHGEAVRVLLEAGAWTHADDGDGNLPLHKAAHNNHAETVWRLLHSDQHLRQLDRASLDWKNHFGWTAVHAAAARGNISVLKLLLDFGAKVDVKNNMCNTPLHEAALNGHVQVCDMLVSYGADVLSVNKMHFKPHELARNNGHFTVVDLLQDPYRKIQMV
eukprot:TRINITY_DN18780_c0_g1_i1.p1 TRINITY_DN18780_c0_g1~~TRINITY_DN18780_c0_g1_i1.p1  ORF type:complete len:279 (+),score=71.40 TRINITY_DN18780_c0_g1_i1:127-963(+)